MKRKRKSTPLRAPRTWSTVERAIAAALIASLTVACVNWAVFAAVVAWPAAQKTPPAQVLYLADAETPPDLARPARTPCRVRVTRAGKTECAL